MTNKPLTAEQLYQREYWRKNKRRIMRIRRTILKKTIADYQRAYQKKNQKKYKAYQAAYRKKYYQTTGR